LKIRVLVVDDEPLSRAELIHLLNHHSQIEVIGEADCGEAVFEKVFQLQPDVVFLDIEMAELSGLDVAKMLQQMKKPPYIVFATAYPNYAVEAFRYEAIDYLLKPFNEEQVQECVMRLIRNLSEKRENHPDLSSRKLAIEVEDGIVYVLPRDILYCCREERDTLIVTTDKTFQTKVSLKELEQKLKGSPFFRTHKSYLVNIEKVEQLIPWFNGAYHVALTGCHENIPVSRNYVKALREVLEL
jgi:two-component system, LytTR family, response regulator LytT